MKRFIGFFIIEFAVIFIVATVVYRAVGVPFALVPIVISSTVSGSIIAFVMAKTRQRACK